MSLKNIDPQISQLKFDFPNEEKEILKFWEEIDAFRTSLKLSEKKPKFTFYDGPPFATGLPHYGHLLAGTIKDIVTRYAHQLGFHVERRFGWDCHGLPIEYEIDKALGIKSPQQVLELGIDKYNAECKKIVMRFSKEWEVIVNRMGRWIDFKNDYKTMNLPFMESVWWVFKQLFLKDQVYLGYKVMPYSTACCTPLSNFEANQNYKDVADPSVVISFPLESDPSVSFLVWTTTPWTLPSNVALCVNPGFDYIQIQDEESKSFWILSEQRLEMIYKDVKKAKFKVIKKYKGEDLKGMKYIPLFNFFPSCSFIVLTDSYVTNDSGTGIVHQAPAFGEDDYRVCLENKIISKESLPPCPIDASGCFTKEVPPCLGMHVKDADKVIQKILKSDGRLIRQSQLEHSYPFCWRSDTPLIYRAIPSWFVRVENIVDKLMKNNAQSRWVPEAIQENRFGNWLLNARDWSISRNRYWGTPIPLWVSEDLSEIVCVGSIQELRDLSGCGPLDDIHRDKIDHIKIPSSKGNGMLKRVDEVFDCWFESGSMPYAQNHYPFERKEEFENLFPADFIAEGLDQTRGWFYTLLVLSTHIFDKPAFKNLIVNGLVLASDGKKMSKRLKNYPEPTSIFDNYGADALRLYLINSPVVRAEPLRFSENGVKDVLKDVCLPWLNSYKFFVGQVIRLKSDENVDYKFKEHKSTNIMDRWILASCQSLIEFVRQEMAAYRLYTVVPRLLKLIEDLTNWYIRFNRKRFKGENGLEDALDAMNTLYHVLLLLCKIMSPFTPFITENMYQGLKKFKDQGENSQSIHFLDFPQVDKSLIDEDILRSVTRMQSVINLGRNIRETKSISLKTPLAELVVIHVNKQYLDDVKSLDSYVYEELNVRNIIFSQDEKQYNVKYRLLADMKSLGVKLKKDAQKVKVGLSQLSSEEIQVFMKEKKITVMGHELTDEFLNVVRYFDETTSNSYESNSDRDVLVLLNTTVDNNLFEEKLAREWINRIQRLRKKVGLNPTDDVDVYYKVLTDINDQLTKMLVTQSELIKKTLKKDAIESKQMPGNLEIYAKDDIEIEGSKFDVFLIKH